MEKEIILKSKKTGNELVILIDEQSNIYANIVGGGKILVGEKIGNINEDMYDEKKVEEMKNYIDIPDLYKIFEKVK